MGFQRSFALLGAAALVGSAVLAQPAVATTVLTYEEQELMVGDTVTVSPLTTPDHCAVFLKWGPTDGLTVTVDGSTGDATVKVVDSEESEYLVTIACGNIDGDKDSLRFGGIPITVVDATPPTDAPTDEQDQDTDPVDTDDEEGKGDSLSGLLGSSDLPRVFAGSSLR